MKNDIMKRVRRLAVLPLMALVVAVSFFGCSDKKYYEEYYVTEGTQILTKFYTIYLRDLVWNNEYSRWEYIAAFNELTEEKYEQAVVQAGVFIDEKDYYNPNLSNETLKTLPYLRSYMINGDPDDTFTETISYDISPGSIAFYVQASDLDNTPPNLNDGMPFNTQKYEFKVSIIWEE